MRDVAAEVTQHVNRVRVQRLQVKERRCLVLGPPDPQRHVGEQQAPRRPSRPSSWPARRRCETVVEVQCQAQPLLPRQRHHLAALPMIVADRLLAQDVATGGQGLHGGLEMIAGILEAAGGHADQHGLRGAQHLCRAGEPRHAQELAAGPRALRDHVAYANEAGALHARVQAGMEVPDGAAADHCHADGAVRRRGRPPLGRPPPMMLRS